MLGSEEREQEERADQEHQFVRALRTLHPYKLTKSSQDKSSSGEEKRPSFGAFAGSRDREGAARRK